MQLVGAISIGSVHTSTSQAATNGSLTTVASSQVSDINVGTKNLLHIGSVLSTLRIVSSPGKAATDTASSVISGVTVLGKAATIDGNGVHVKSGPKVPKSVAKAYQKVLDTIFAKADFGLKQASILRSNSRSGHSVSIAGLDMFFKHTVKGVPPLNVGFPPGVPCPLPSTLPVDPCAGVGFNLNAKYRGQIALGQVGAISLAQPPIPTPKPPKLPGGSGGPNPGGGTVGTNPGGGGGFPVRVVAPAASRVAARRSRVRARVRRSPHPSSRASTQALADPFAGLSGRLWWFFPLIAISVLALIGRLRIPARLPSH